MSLKLLGALDEKGELTPTGTLMNRFPIEPALARALLAASGLGCLDEVLGIVSVLSTSSKLFFDSSGDREVAAEARARFRHASGDHLTALNALRHYEDLVKGGAGKGQQRDWCRTHFVNEQTLREATNIQEQLRAICVRLELDKDSSSGDNVEPILEALFYGRVQNCALYRQEEKSYRHMMSPSVSDTRWRRNQRNALNSFHAYQLMKIHPGSVLSERRPPVIMYDELVSTDTLFPEEKRKESVNTALTSCSPSRGMHEESPQSALHFFRGTLFSILPRGEAQP